ncbi:hypothetical protein HJC23_008289 [Cyclotella cryptica]|uniref:Uncharacterized protein n=1 Tax=Cyclotella cryptica TaxID=29204 RepID=A0ABD3PCM2_9STRA
MPRSRSRSKSPGILAQAEELMQHAFDTAQLRRMDSNVSNRKAPENTGRFKLQLSRGSSQGSGPRERNHRSAKHTPSEKVGSLRHKAGRRRSQSSDSIERRHEEAQFTSSDNSSDSMHHESRCRSQSPNARVFSNRHGGRRLIDDNKTKSSKSMYDSKHKAIRGRMKCPESEVLDCSPPRRQEVTMIRNKTPSERVNDFRRRHRHNSPNTGFRPPRSTRKEEDVKIHNVPTRRHKQPAPKSTRHNNPGRRYQVPSSPLQTLKTCREDEDNTLSDWPISPLHSDLITCHVRRSSFTSELTCSVSSLATDPSSVKSTSFNDRCDEKLSNMNSLPVNCDENGYCIHHKGFRLYKKCAPGRFVKLHDFCSVCIANESLGSADEPSITAWKDINSYAKQVEGETFDNERSLTAEIHSNAMSNLDQMRDFRSRMEEAPKFTHPLGAKSVRVPPFISFHEDSETSSSDSGEAPDKWRMLLGKAKSSSCHQYEYSGEMATKSTCRSSFMSGSSDPKSQFVYTHDYERQKSVSSWPQRESKLMINSSMLQPTRRSPY